MTAKLLCATRATLAHAAPPARPGARSAASLQPPFPPASSTSALDAPAKAVACADAAVAAAAAPGVNTPSVCLPCLLSLVGKKKAAAREKAREQNARAERWAAHTRRGATASAPGGAEEGAAPLPLTPRACPPLRQRCAKVANRIDQLLRSALSGRAAGRAAPGRSHVRRTRVGGAMASEAAAPSSPAQPAASAGPSAPPRSEQVIKYTYIASEERWEEESGRVRVRPEVFARGGMRSCFPCDDIDSEGGATKAVLKLFHDDVPALLRGGNAVCDPKEYFLESMCSAVADTYAQSFNREAARAGGVAAGVAVAFVPVSVVYLIERPGRVFGTVEPMLVGSYKKHSDNDGHRDRLGEDGEDEVAQAFSYFSYVRSNNLLMVCDIQGVPGGAYTDPQVHSWDGNGFGAGNNGRQGMERFLASFSYNLLCEALQLPRAKEETDEEMAKRLQEVEVQTAREDNDWCVMPAPARLFRA